MQYTIDQIRSLRDCYLDPPYPDFSLEEVVRRSKLVHTKLVRGENAWVAKGTAQTTEEWVARLVQGTLNKISESNYDVMINKLRTKDLFATPEILNNVVRMIFMKALDEPENSRLYAAVCYDLAVFEVTMTGAPQQQRKSLLRDAIVYTSQQEFQVYRRDDVATDEKFSEEERELLRTNFMRRKRANMRFVGELYRKDVLSGSTIFTILDVTMKLAAAGGFPPAEKIELLTELLITTGERLDSQQKKKLDNYFMLLAGLVENTKHPYPHRIRFKILDLIDLRKRGWKEKQMKPTSPTTKNTKSGAASSLTSKKGGKSFPETKNWKELLSNRHNTGNSAGGGSSSNANQSGSVGSSSANAGSGAASDAQGLAKRTEKAVPFEARVRSMFMQWVSECNNDFILEWMDEFNDCDREFDNHGLCVAVAMEVIKDACTTTRKDAQREAFSFLVVGLFLTDEEVMSGFAESLAAAIEDGLLEDVPKFSERFMQMLRLTSTEEEIVADVYYDAANVLRMAYNKLTYIDEETVPTLMSFWEKVQVQNPDEEPVLLGFPVLYTLCETAGALDGLENLLASILNSLHNMGIVDDVAIQEFMDYDGDNSLCRKVATAYKAL